MKKMLLLGLCAILYTGTALGQWTETEPNDELNEAGVKTITSNGTVSGNFVTFDVDIFKISPGAHGTISVTFNTAPAVNQVQLVEVGSNTVVASALLSQNFTYLLNPTKAYYLKTYTGLATGAWSLTVSGINFTTLPVTLTHFNAQQHHGGIELQWTTASETNHSHFQLERRQDSDFSLVASIPGKGSQGSTSHYSYQDQRPFPGTNYYRLSQVDKDGTKTTYAEKAVNFSLSTANFSTYPNPATTIIEASFTKGRFNKAKIIDPSGKQRHSKAITPSEEIISLPLAHLSPGIYFLSLSGKETVVQKFIKQ